MMRRANGLLSEIGDRYSYQRGNIQGMGSNGWGRNTGLGRSEL